MRRRYIRTEPGRTDEITAAVLSAAVAAGVGVVTFYLVRLMLAREPLETELGALPERAGAEE